eukprot:TRINITY_DN6845_c0_g1_i1.p1 TRINITY_DN6845_c0_g1~~TRINITY_DN6845_c0_g1_i1.p1  ORF type:complete len:669 (+),score=93.64 TRINITY_DN6845_c0_g1_i1:55-2061(+)
MGDLDECGLVGRFTLALAPTNDALPHVLRCPRCRFLSSTQWHDLTFVPNNAHSPIERHHTNITENMAIHSSVISETHFNTHAILTLYSHDVASRIGPHLSHTRVFAIDPPSLFAATCHTLMLTACEAIAHLTNPPDSHTSIKQEKSVIGNGDSSTLVQSDHGNQEIHHSGQGGMDFITLYAKPRTSITLDSRVKIIPLQSHVDHSEQVGELSSFASHCQQCYIPSYLSQHESWEYAKVLSDLVCGNRALHRVVMLSRSSDYFHAMFCGELSNSKKPSFLNEADFTSHVIDTALSRCYGIPISTQPRQVDWVPCYSLATYWGDLSMQKELIELAKSEVQKHGLIPFTEAFKESHTLPPPLQHAWNTLQEHYLSLLCESNRLIYVESPYVAISADALKWLATQDPIWKLSELSRAQILISWIRATPRELQEQRDVVRCWLETCLDVSLLPSCYVHDLHIDTETKACTKPLKPGKIKAAHTEHKRPNLNLSGLYNVPDEKLAEFTKKPFSCVNLSGCWRLSNSAIKFFSLQQNNIEELYLDDCTSLRCEIPEVLFMRLKAFSARRTPICVIPSFKPSKSAKKLQVLLLSGCLWLKGSFLKKLLRQFGPTLKSVSLDDCPNITQDDFEDYLPAMAKIQDVSRSHNSSSVHILYESNMVDCMSYNIQGCRFYY